MSLPSLGSIYHRFLLLLPFASDSFNYDNPNTWILNYPQCQGLQQSPIPIYSNKVVPISLPPLIYGLYDVLFQKPPTVLNNGHTIEFEVPDTIFGEKPFITGGFLEDIYVSDQVHFHWGSPGQGGSEHVFNGRQYDVEMHIVHRNSKYSSLQDARDYKDGIAVLAVLFKMVKSSELIFPGLNEIYEILDELKFFNSSVETKNEFTLGSLMGHIDGDNFYTYRGSLTTPPCSESVTWHVYPQVLPISYKQLPKFWFLLDSRGNSLINNFRPLQVLGYRKVYHRQPFTKHFNFF